MTHQIFLRRLFERLRSSYPGISGKSQCGGTTLEVTILFPDDWCHAEGVTLARPLDELQTADERLAFESRLRELVAKVRP